MIARRLSPNTAAKPIPAPKPEDLLGQSLMDRLDRLDVMCRKVLAGKLPGERRSKRRGRSVEFDDHRPYSAGDDLRHINWHVLGRLDRLVLKLFREDEDLSITIIVDASPSMEAGEPSKRTYAMQLASALAYLGLARNNRVSVHVVCAPGKPLIQRSAMMRARSSIRPMLGFLANAIQPGETVPAQSDPDALLTAVSSVCAQARSPGVRFLISDMLTRADANQTLSALVATTSGLGADAVLLHTLSPGEIDPSREEHRGLIGDVRLTDAEDLRAAELTLTDDAIAQYKQRLGQWQQSLIHACRARDIVYRLVQTDTDVADLLSQELRRDGVLG
ncbi:MAG: DUF58 domain-containing protein [Phycisphaeraceae bacterium]|nr:DUF58 domain-containing protein [Phycisphaerales bacterium]MCB9860195.1 DUF58 domain-containing protein [Phycisphaeraceae bacterium]